MIDSELEKRVLTRADRIITVGQTLASAFAEKAEIVAGKTMYCPMALTRKTSRGWQPQSRRDLL
jgi:hypothetical protein